MEMRYGEECLPLTQKKMTSWRNVGDYISEVKDVAPHTQHSRHHTEQIATHRKFDTHFPRSSQGYLHFADMMHHPCGLKDLSKRSRPGHCEQTGVERKWEPSTPIALAMFDYPRVRASYLDFLYSCVWLRSLTLRTEMLAVTKMCLCKWLRDRPWPRSKGQGSGES